MLKNGFTLVEVLVVVSIIGILLTFSFAGLQGARSSSRDAQRKADLEDIRSALEIYRADCGSYPASITFGVGSLVGSGGTNCPVANVYMSKIPQDPQNASKSTKYEYIPGSSNSTYTLCAPLEHVTASVTGCANSATQKCGTTGCNYAKTNP